MEKKVHIAHVTQAMGGVKTHIKYIIENIDSQQYIFDIVAPFDKELKALAEKRGINYHIISFERNVHVFKDLASLWRLYFLIKKKKYDIVHLHSAKAGAIGRIVCFLLKQKSVFTPNGFSYLGSKGLKRTVFFTVETFLKNMSDKLLAVSNCEANRAINELGLNKDKVAVVKNSIKPLEQNVKERNREVKVITTIGRLTYQKNLLKFVEIAKEVLMMYPHIEFRILGAGYHDDQKEEIYQLINEYNLAKSIKIIEWSYDISINNYLSESDIYISTSIFEGLPYSILEAMSLGIPCVASFCDGNNDIIDHKYDGILCNDQYQFVKAISDLIADEEMRVRIGKNAVKTVEEKFNIKNNILLLSKEYLKILEL